MDVEGIVNTGEHSPHDPTLGFGKVLIAGKEVYGEGHDKGGK